MFTQKEMSQVEQDLLHLIKCRIAEVWARETHDHGQGASLFPELYTQGSTKYDAMCGMFDWKYDLLGEADAAKLLLELEYYVLRDHTRGRI